MSKICTGCGETKAATEYYKRAATKDGLQSRCKSCKKARDKAYREANKESLTAGDKTYREANKERIQDRNKTYYEANKERIQDQSKVYYEVNKERILAREKAYRARRVSNSPCAIYSIFCVPEQRYYIGQTVCAPSRWGAHNRRFKNNKNVCGAGEMQNDYNKHGQESFEYTILKELPADANKETRLEEEKNYILQFLTEGKSLYNARNTTE